MLIDDAHREGSVQAIGDLNSAQKFVLSPHVVEAAWDLSKSHAAIEKNKEYVFTPAVNTWIEWSGDGAFQSSFRHGLFLFGQDQDEDLKHTVGVGAYIYDRDAQHSTLDFVLVNYFLLLDDGPILSHGVDSISEQDLNGLKSTEKGADYIERSRAIPLERLGRFLIAVLAIIATPRFSLVRDRDLSKINAKRAKNSRPALISYRDVIINPQSKWVAKSALRQMSKDERRRHHVVSFLRLRRGNIELVTAHWRGNRAKGYILHRHVVEEVAEGFRETLPILPKAIIMPPGYIAPGDK